MGIGSMLVGIFIGAVGYSTLPTTRPLIDRIGEHTYTITKYLGEALIFVGEVLK